MLPGPDPLPRPDAHLDPSRPLETRPPEGGYRVSIPVFEGPIDLLLYLIKKNELDIHEVSLTSIAQEYLEFVDLIRLVDLERAGEFIVVASTLMKMKSRSLFLAREEEEDLAREETEHEALVRYLLEYQKLGGAAEKLAEQEALRSGVYPRAGEKVRVMEEYAPRDNAPDYVLFDLLTAIRDVLSNAPKTPTHEVELFNVNPEMKQREILEIIRTEGKVDFLDLVGGKPKLIVVITFIAVLELIRKGMIRILQSSQFGRITLYDSSDNKITNT